MPLVLLGVLVSSALAGCDATADGPRARAVPGLGLEQRVADFQEWTRAVKPMQTSVARIVKGIAAQAESAPSLQEFVDAAHAGSTKITNVLVDLVAVKVPPGPLEDFHERLVAQVRAAQVGESKLAAALSSGSDGFLDEVAEESAEARRSGSRLNRDVEAYARSLGLTPVGERRAV